MDDKAHRLTGKAARSTRGQSLVEFVLAIPLLLLIVVSIIYFGKVFHTSQVLTYAAQEGARAATRIPNLRDPAVREAVRGFSMSGQQANSESVIYAAMAGGRLLSEGESGDLPPGAKIKILPWDSDGSPRDSAPPGTVAVLIEYPYSLLLDPFSGQASGQTTSVSISLAPQDENPVPFPDFQMSEKATVTQEVFQEVN